MTSALARRLDRLEAIRKAREPMLGLILLGTEETIDQQYEEAVAGGRHQPGSPLVRIIMTPLKPRGEKADDTVS